MRQRDEVVGPMRMLALDLDGTLAVGRYEISRATCEALARASRNGIEVVIATGRRYNSALKVVRSLAQPPPVLCLEGVLLKSNTGETLFSHALPAADLSLTATVLADFDMAIVGYRDSHSLGGPDLVIDASVTGNARIQRFREMSGGLAEPCESLRDSPRDDILLATSFGERDQLLAAEAALHERHPNRFATNVMPVPGSDSTYFEALRAGFSKWSGLLHLAELRGIDPASICAVGDEQNDMPMIEGAGMGVAMGNATEALKQAADWVCGPNDQDGIVQVVDRILS